MFRENVDKGDVKDAASSPKSAIPSINLPKGGGAIRGMGEKFAANPVTGTGSLSVPIATSPGRSGFGPQLSLSYDSGAGNGPFGFGWSLPLPAITRKTDKGLPQYRDAEESDLFILSGAEDLVPVLAQNAQGKWVQESLPPRTVDNKTYRIQRYRPRIEGLFARIERWTNTADAKDVHWRSISKDNILTLYGKNAESRIADPDDPRRIFSWMICETRDDKGNAVLYEYKPEDGTGIDLTRAHERNRGDRNDPRRTADRYLKHIKYGNRVPALDTEGRRPAFLSSTDIQNAGWMFEVVFDYGEHDVSVPKPDDPGEWSFRDDPFSTYRAGFEVRTTRLCRRALMFHHFPDEPGVGADCLVRSTDFTYFHEQDPDHARNPVYTFLKQVTQSGYKRLGSTYLKRSLPSVEFEYTQPVVQDAVHDVDAESLENLPIGVDGAAYQWTDLHGEGIPGILTEQTDAWFYKRNLSPISKRPVEFAPLECVAVKPDLALTGGAQFMDLAGDGQPDLVLLDGPMPGLYEHDEAEGWQPFRPFTSRLNRDTRDPNLKFVDLNGDGHADVLITEDDVFVWHASLAEEGFGPARRVAQTLDEENGPRLVFADGTQSIYLADLSGDCLTDLVCIRNGEVCYWPNLGYGRFGAKVTMDHAPHFDNPDQFDHKRIRLADIDGSGTTDIIYLHRDGVRLYFNQSGNSWSEPQVLNVFPRVDDLVSIVPTDLLGNGTACLVWSSPLPGDTRRPMRYVNLMGGQKPHLLVKTTNNLGAETLVQYASSTKFYLQDKRDGKPWITRLPFPVHVVERVQTHDLISRNRFVTRYAYHHGYFDGDEREFRGFGMVEQFDTEELAALTESGDFPDAVNIDAASYVPTLLTKTWFHTGVYLEGERISRHFEDEYYHEGDESEGVSGLTDEQLDVMLLPDTELPSMLKRQDGSSIPWELRAEEIQEACRALKGLVLRREIYALDGTDEEDRPYSATEQNYIIELLQPQGDDKHAVFFSHPRESIDFHYERKLAEVAGKKIADPRVTHDMTLEVDGYGNVLKSVAVGYGRRPGLSPLQGDDKQKQEQIHITFTENEVTNPIDEADDYRTPLPCETRSYELLKIVPDSNLKDVTNLFRFEEMVAKVDQAGDGLHELPYEDIDGAGATANHPYRRLIEHVRTLYRRNDLSAAVPLGQVDPLAIPYESYKLAFTPGLVAEVYGGRVTDAMIENEGRYVHSEGDTNWWIPSGRVFLSPNIQDTAAQELAYARQHFFQPHRYRDPFHTNAVSTESFVNYDAYDLLTVETRDALGNTASAVSDYRVLAPRLMTDPNGNRSEVKFDAVGLVAGTAVMGKEGENLGDTLNQFKTDLTQDDIDGFYDVEDPHVPAPNLLKGGTTRIIYDLDRFKRLGEPPFAATLARETHVSDPLPPQGLKIQISFSYSDGFGREIQKKIQAEPGPVVEDGPIVNPRWVGSGWTVFNNKGKPVRQYEPFFSQLPEKRHRFEFGVQVGVSPILFYDPVERVVATLHTNHTWEKVVFDPWQQEGWDVNDTVLVADPSADADVGEFFRRLPNDEYLPIWYERRIGGALGSQEQDAANKAAVHAGTPSVAYADSLGRTFLTVSHNKFERNGTTLEEKYATRVELDIEGNQREVIDANGRIVMRYDYDMLGDRIHQASMEAGERWMLNDVAGKPIRAWDSRGHQFKTEYDQLWRPTRQFVCGTDMTQSDPRTLNSDIVFAMIEYGEGQANDTALNLRTRAFKSYDGAGVVTNEGYDFKGNLRRSSRTVADDYKKLYDWNNDAVQPSWETFTSSTTYDALNRPISVTTPDNSVCHPTFNEANLLESVDVNLRGAQTATPFVANIDYNAKGQRGLIEYGNGASTSYDYDPDTFRLTNLKTTRPANLNGLATQLLKNPGTVQDLHYTYDPAGNITRIADEALPVIFNNNQPVDPVCSYIYDALYRLIQATGREHIGQTARVFDPPYGNRRDYPFAGLADFIAHPNDLQAMRPYTERYEYDGVGNFQFVRHSANGGSWTRGYEYAAASLIEPAKQSNRLTKTTIGNGTTFPETYTYTDALGNDMHGCMTAINSMKMVWDFKDQLQQVDLGGGGTAYYVYDSGGQRLRKVWEKSANLIEERIYLGGFEIYRRRQGAERLERETLHITGIALVETRATDTAGNDPAPPQLIRYQFGNHIGSSSLELDDQARIISYEEYTPNGNTSYQAVRSQTETPKRYRYAGMERDEETGFAYHGARYYTKWLGRWISPDPIGLSNDGTNLYSYARNNPTNYVDPLGFQAKDPWADPEEDFQGAKNKEENDERHKRLMGLQAILIGDRPSERDLKKYFHKTESFGDIGILRRYGFKEYSLSDIGDPRYMWPNGNAKQYQDRIIDAIRSYDEDWRRIKMLPRIQAGYEPSSNRKEAIQLLMLEGAEYISQSIAAGTVEGLWSIGTDDPVKLTAAAGAGYYASGAVGGMIYAKGQQLPSLSAPRAQVTEVQSKAASAEQIHEAAGGPQKFRDYNPTAVLETAQGDPLIARGPTKKLNANQIKQAEKSGSFINVKMPNQRDVAKPDRIHPDYAVLVRSAFLGLTPTKLTVSGQPICNVCFGIIQAFGGVMVEFGSMPTPPEYRGVVFFGPK